MSSSSSISSKEPASFLVRSKDEYKGKVSAEDIIGACKAALPPYAVPKYVEFRDSLPLTATEKLWKKQLRDEAVAKMKEKGELR